MEKRPNIPVARTLRRETATDVERALWYRLRNRQIAGAKFRRQHSIGPYIVDFACLESALIVELDGGQHDRPEIRRHDDDRTAWLEEQGYRVLRFWNNDVTDNMDGVLEMIATALVHAPPPAGGRGSG